MGDMQTDVSSAPTTEPPRRSFLVRLAAAVAGAIAALFPFAAGWGVITDPCARARKTAGNDGRNSDKFVPVCPLDALPADGVPRPFAIIADATDAWTHSLAQRIGAVFLSRTDKDPARVTAFSATCPHLGCAVDFDQANNRFECPCHKSSFATDGQKLFGPSRRGLDPLPVKLAEKAGAKEIMVAFERFEAGIAERKPIE